MAYSSGFSPHPRISYANAAPTGAASEAEYLEIALVSRRDPQDVRAALDQSLPVGLDVVEVVESPGGALADRLTGSRWRVRLPGVDVTDLARAVESFRGRDEIIVHRMMKSGLREFDARSAVVEIAAEGDELVLLVAHGTPLIRPDDIVQALRSVDDGLLPGQAMSATRLAQGTLAGATLADPLA